MPDPLSIIRFSSLEFFRIISVTGLLEKKDNDISQWGSFFIHLIAC